MSTDEGKKTDQKESTVKTEEEKKTDQKEVAGTTGEIENAPKPSEEANGKKPGGSG